MGLNRSVTFNHMEWYVMEELFRDGDFNTVTLLAKECIGVSIFHDHCNQYIGSTVQDYLTTYYDENFTEVDNAIKNTDQGKLYLLSFSEVKGLSSLHRSVLRCNRPVEKMTFDGWWLCTPSINNMFPDNVAAVGTDGRIFGGGGPVTDILGVRPALKLDLSKVTFDPVTVTYFVK